VHVPYRGIEALNSAPHGDIALTEVLEASYKSLYIALYRSIRRYTHDRDNSRTQSIGAMARRPRSSKLETRTDRLNIAARQKPYHFTTISPGIALGYRRGKDRNAWVVRCADGRGGNWLKNLPGVPDDHEDANGQSVIDFWMAQDAARRLARGSDDNGRPVSVDEALLALSPLPISVSTASSLPRRKRDFTFESFEATVGGFIKPVELFVQPIDGAAIVSKIGLGRRRVGRSAGRWLVFHGLEYQTVRFSH